MTDIEKLIEQYCPEGVEYKSFSEIGSYVRGITYNKTQENNTGDEEGWKVFRANNITLSSNTLNYDDVKIVQKNVKVKECQMLKEHDILICAGSGSKEHIGKVAYINEDMDYTFGGFMGVLRADEDFVLSRFLFHVLTGRIFKDYLSETLNSSTINNLNSQIMNDFEIPLPPIEIQQKIVDILDKFSLLSAELKTELKLRKKQYEYYRTRLLSFDSNAASVQWRTLGEIGTFYGGLSGKSKADFSDGNAKYITYMNVYTNASVDFNSCELVKVSPTERQNKIEYGDVLLTGSSETPEECAISSVVTVHPTENIYLNSFCFGYRFNSLVGILPDFYKHYFRCYAMREKIRKTANGVTRFNVSKKEFAKLSIPIISMQDQQRIVNILDKFESLVNDISTGLPAEIDLVQKQYEYYRNKLLSFDRAE